MRTEDVVRTAALVAALALPTGCVTFDAKLDASGGATATMSHVIDPKGVSDERKSIQGPHVSVESDSLDNGRVTFRLKVDDATKLSTSKYFERTTVTLKDGANARTRDLTVTIRNPTPRKLADRALEKFGKEARISIEFPGDVVSSNATETNGRVLAWVFPTNDFLGRPEILLKATFKAPSLPPAS